MSVAQATAVERPVNIASRLTKTARSHPNQTAVVEPGRRQPDGTRHYNSVTFAELDSDSDRIAAGLRDMGIQRGMRIALMVRPGIDFISLTFALFKAGAVIVLIDPGMGRTNLLGCLQAVRPEGFVAIPMVHAIRTVLRRRFPESRLHVTVGRRWFWGGVTLAQLRASGSDGFQAESTRAEDDAAIIFTSGSTGPPKGVLYSHGNFDAQVDEIRDRYEIEPGGCDLSGFPLFALFNAAMATTTVIPDMDPTRPAQVDPRRIVEAVNDWNVTQAFGSPAIWNAVGLYCTERKIQLPTIKRILSAGAPVPPHVLQWMKLTIAADGDIYTPYGATESLPVASIAASQVLSSTAMQSAQGAGTCVGNRFARIDWRVIRISDEAITSIAETESLPCGEIGELIVRGPVVTRRYVTRVEANALAKINDGDTFWHRMGDVGYLDEKDRFWFCGRKAHRVQTAAGTMYTIRCEAIFNRSPSIFRSALVGVGKPSVQTPVMICEPWPEQAPRSAEGRRHLLLQLAELGQSCDLTREILPEHILLHESLPVDIRHNAKICREELATWAAERIGKPHE